MKWQWQAFTLALMLTLFGGAATSDANYAASPPNEIAIGALAWVDEQGEWRTIREWTDGKRVLVLVPGFLTCQASCPIITDNLRALRERTPHFGELQFLFLSFDPQDATRGLRGEALGFAKNQDTMAHFRAHHHLSKAWSVGVLPEQSVAKQFLAQFSYSFQILAEAKGVGGGGGGFDHPNTAFVFSSGDLVWTGSLFGAQIAAWELEKAYQQAHLVHQKGLQARFLQFVGKKEYLLLYGVIGMLAPLLGLGVLWWTLKRKPLGKI